MRWEIKKHEKEAVKYREQPRIKSHIEGREFLGLDDRWQADGKSALGWLQDFWNGWMIVTFIEMGSTTRE